MSKVREIKYVAPDAGILEQEKIPLKNFKRIENFEERVKKFEVGKVYWVVTNATLVHILAEIESLFYENVFVAEYSSGEISYLHQDDVEKHFEVPLSTWYARWLGFNPESIELREKYDEARKAEMEEMTKEMEEMTKEMDSPF